MKEIIGGIFIWIVALVAIMLVSFGMYAWMKPATIAIDNRAFHESQPYNDSMAKDLGNFQLEYLRVTDPDKRAALRAIILDRYAGYDETRLNPSLRSFLDSLKNRN